METLSELIKLAQGERTQNQFALHCGIGSSTLTRLIKGTRNPKPEILKKIAAKAYNGITYEMLMQAAGFMANPEKDNKLKFSAEEIKLINDYRSLNFACKKLVMQTIETLKNSTASSGSGKAEDIS